MINLTSQTSLKLPFLAKNCIYLQQDNQQNLELLSEQSLQYKTIFVLGNGTNLVAKTNFDGLVIKIQLLGKQIIGETDNEFIISAAAGENWHDFIVWCINNNAYGLENLSHIPGQVGSTPIQNVGAYGVEVSQFIDKVYAWNLREKCYEVFENSQCKFSYRNSIFKQQSYNQSANLIITKIVFKLPKANSWKANLSYADLQNYFQNKNTEENITPQKIVDALKIIRGNKIPDYQKFPNVGSFFQNPSISIENLSALQKQFDTIKIPFKLDDTNQQTTARIAAAWLIENIGFKGKQIGNFSMSKQHPLILVNHDGKGNREELDNFVTLIQNEIKTKFNILLKPEPVFL